MWQKDVTTFSNSFSYLRKNLQISHTPFVDTRIVRCWECWCWHSIIHHQQRDTFWKNEEIQIWKTLEELQYDKRFALAQLCCNRFDTIANISRGEVWDKDVTRGFKTAKFEVKLIKRFYGKKCLIFRNPRWRMNEKPTNDWMNEWLGWRQTRTLLWDKIQRYLNKKFMTTLR